MINVIRIESGSKATKFNEQGMHEMVLSEHRELVKNN